MTVWKEPCERQLQFWNPKTKYYEPVAGPAPHPNHVRTCMAQGRAWRICRVDRPLKNPRITVPHRNGFSRTVEQVQKVYLEWAQAKGLPAITSFYSLANNKPSAFKPYGSRRDRTPLPEPEVIFTGEIRYVDAGKYFAVEHTEEE